jgi:GNAT superfamily N-acetyltransferase
MPHSSFHLTRVRSPADLDATIKLFRAYAASLDIDLSYQDFEGEMQALPGKYAPPTGELFLARDAGGRPVGCVGLRAVEPEGCCEMKRLYVLPEARGTGLGKALIDAVVREAGRIGYREMRLDTLPSMLEAQTLYRRCGFEAMEAYYATPVTGTLFMRRSLDRPLPGQGRDSNAAIDEG